MNLGLSSVDVDENPEQTRALRDDPVARTPGVLEHPLDEDLVLQRPDHGDGFLLNATAARIWTLCDGTRSAAAVAHIIAADYAIHYARAYADVTAFVDALREVALLAR